MSQKPPPVKYDKDADIEALRSLKVSGYELIMSIEALRQQIGESTNSLARINSQVQVLEQRIAENSKET